MALLLKGLIRLYQLTLSPWLGPSCRFTPTCSAYAMEAIDRHGALHGARLAIKRLLRCHPFGGAGYDPVPELDEGGEGHV
jgi:putative membrane protein insertion efficiency factor